MSKHRDTRRSRSENKLFQAIFHPPKNYKHQRKHTGVPGLPVELLPRKAYRHDK